MLHIVAHIFGVLCSLLFGFVVWPAIAAAAVVVVAVAAVVMNDNWLQDDCLISSSFFFLCSMLLLSAKVEAKRIGTGRAAHHARPKKEQNHCRRTQIYTLSLFAL